jgi:hypothetical protein
VYLDVRFSLNEAYIMSKTIEPDIICNSIQFIN